MLPKELRLSKKKDFDEVFRRGRKKVFRHFFVHWQRTNLGHPRVGIIVSNKVSKKAVIRNTIRRRVREIIWKTVGRDQSIDTIILAKQGSVNASYLEIKEDIQKGMEEILRQAKNISV